MKPNRMKRVLLNREIWLQTVLWTLFFATINVQWTNSWIKVDFLPESVPPHFAIAIPILFLVNVYWLIPTLLTKKKWFFYVSISFTLLMGFEVVRSLVFSEVLGGEISFQDEFSGSNSILFGKLNVMTITFIVYSFLYRFGRDWIIHQSLIRKLQLELNSINKHEIVKKDKDVKETFSIKKKQGSLLLHAKDVVYFQAQGDFVFAIDKEHKKHIINDSLRNITNQIDARTFFQINRSEVINFHFVEKYHAYIKNRLEIKIQNSKDLLYTSNSRTPMFRTWVNSH